MNRAVPYLIIGLAIIAVSFNFGYRSSLSKTRVSGVASYLVPYDLANPSAPLVRDVLGEAAAAFTGRGIIVLIGNSVIHGFGTIDRNYLNRGLAAKRDVINAGADGDFLIASLALAIYGLDLALGRHPNQQVDVFVAYPLNRFYVKGDYWAFGQAIADLCRERRLEKYVAGCEQLPPSPWHAQVYQMLERLVLGNMRCIPTEQDLWNVVSHRITHCTHLFDGYETDRAFLDRHNHVRMFDPEMGPPSHDSVLASFDWLFRTETIADAVTSIRERADYLRRFLVDRGVPYKFHLVILPDDTSTLRALNSAEIEKISLGQRQVLESAHTLLPTWSTTVLNGFGDAEFIGGSHLTESGQDKVNEAILGELGS